MSDTYQLCKEFWEAIRSPITISCVCEFRAKLGHFENNTLPSKCVQKRLNVYAHTISGICACWWERATSSRSPKTGRFYVMKSAPTVRQRISGHSGLKDPLQVDASFCNSDMDLVDNKSFCVRPSLCQQSSSCIIYTSAVWRRPFPIHHTGVAVSYDVDVFICMQVQWFPLWPGCVAQIFGVGWVCKVNIPGINMRLILLRDESLNDPHSTW